MILRPATLIACLLFLHVSCIHSDEAFDANYKDVMEFELQYEAAKNVMEESPQEAVSLLTKARQAALASNSKENVAKTWYLEGYINDMHNRQGEAYRAFLESEMAYETLNDTVWVEKSLRYQAAILLRLPEVKQALTVLDHAKNYTTTPQAHYRQQYLKGVAAYLNREYQEAGDIFSQVVENCLLYEDLDYLAQARNYMGLVALGQKDYGLASEYFNKSADTNAGDKSCQLTALNNLGLLYEEKNDISSAMEYYSKALDIPVTSGGLRHHMVAAINLSNLYMKQGNPGKTSEILESSLQRLRQVQDPAQLETAYSLLIRAYEAQGRKDEMKKIWRQLELVKNDREDLLKKQSKLEVQLAELTIRKRNAGGMQMPSPWYKYLQIGFTFIIFLAGVFMTIQFFRQRKAIKRFNNDFHLLQKRNREKKELKSTKLTSVG